MFKKILIANRGEVAVRIIRACREMAIPTVAVYSEADADSYHSVLSTESYCIGPKESAKSYLDMQAIISTAVTCGADAIHPGYGFLAERADFADLCKVHNICFIGPSGDIIRKMGDKSAARATMISNGIPVIPGTGIINNIEEAREFCSNIGYPVIVKASAGGGGKGMRIVNSEDELEENITLCRSEAESFFGNSDICS